RAAKHEQAPRHEAEFVLRLRGEFLEKSAARQVKIAQQRRGTRDMRVAGRAEKPPAPTREIEIQTRADVERALRIHHALQPARDHSGRSEWNKVARHDHPGVAERA